MAFVKHLLLVVDVSCEQVPKVLAPLFPRILEHGVAMHNFVSLNKQVHVVRYNELIKKSVDKRLAPAAAAVLEAVVAPAEVAQQCQ